MASRLLKELKELNKIRHEKEKRKAEGNDTGKFQDDELILAPETESNIWKWIGSLRGPPETPYADARFKIQIDVPKTYPHAAPKVRFVTKVCHPNVHLTSGEICLDVLKEAWTPIWTLETVCTAIVALLAAPDASSPLNCDAGNLIRSGDLKGFNSLARMYTLDFAELLPGALISK